MKGDPTYTDQKHAKKLLFETGMLKCLSSGGTAGDIGNVQALVTEIISQNPTIAPSDESSQYFKSDAVHNCELAILNADIVACDFSDFIAADYFSGHKICHLTPSRKFRLDNQNH
ncbi:hypothetical protein LEP1GSC185_0590 [Leptospira licerasiae serovar Varillal str. VAR 010]|uniref:Uncharacterized protein n=2 Tax=Leptospira licerasiae TaxID=447106 RepID=A0ABN0H7I8_9LEPT|nr:hypothetical protein LEP1GSC185_0590 [Leptospira licerasiae serovar Varillal str. VAR 010]EJZ41505.1 hypothetical protein LEP1GSC178_3952 [Leptospira licerasiae str. MMD4847]